MNKKIMFFTLTGLVNTCSFDQDSQNSSSCYRVLHNQAHALMYAKKKLKKEIEHFTFIGPAAGASFNLESQNSSSRYRELHNPAQALMEAKSKKKKIQVLVPKSLIIKPKP
jgi:hypothetical protein